MVKARQFRVPAVSAGWLDELVDAADWAEQTALRSEADPPRYVTDSQAAHHCRVLLFELAQASDWGAEKRAKDAARRAAARARREADRVVRAQGVGNVVDDTNSEGRCVTTGQRDRLGPDPHKGGRR